MLDNLLNDIKQTIIDFFIYVWRKFKYIIVGIIILICIFSIIFFKKDTPTSIETQEIYLFKVSLSNWLTWITIITVPITAVWAIHQYKKSRRIRQQERGAEIAKLFSDDLLKKCSILGVVIQNSELQKILRFKEIHLNKLERFDLEEIRELYNNPEIDKIYKNLMNSNNMQLIYLYILESQISLKEINDIAYIDESTLKTKMKELMKDKYTEEELIKLENRKMLKREFTNYYIEKFPNSDLNGVFMKKYTDEEARKLFILDNKNMPFLFKNLVEDVLNELEFICMNISSQSAGTEFVYQSLHQIFLKTIKILAIQIAIVNVNYRDKYYTNIIHVYKEWNNIDKKKRKIENKNKKKAYKYLEPKVSKI